MFQWGLRCNGWQLATQKSKGIIVRIGSMVQNELEESIDLCSKFK